MASAETASELRATGVDSQSPLRAGSGAAERAEDGVGKVRPEVLTAAVAGVVAVFWPTFHALWQVWEIDPNYSHGFMVPLASLVIGVVAWRRHSAVLQGAVSRADVGLGCGAIAAGIGTHYVAWLAGILLLDVAALVLTLRGAILVLEGRAANRVLGFSTLFLIFMAPLPMAWYQSMAIAMQNLVSAVSAFVLEGMGAAVYREGYFIHLTGYTMEVGQACSGLRQLTAVLALSLAIGYMHGRGAWYCAALGLLSIPIAVAANCVRVILTGVIMMLFGAEWADGVFHTLEGLAIVGVAALMVLGAAWGLGALVDLAGRRRVPPAPVA